MTSEFTVENPEIRPDLGRWVCKYPRSDGEEVIVDRYLGRWGWSNDYHSFESEAEIRMVHARYKVDTGGYYPHEEQVLCGALVNDCGTSPWYDVLDTVSPRIRCVVRCKVEGNYRLFTIEASSEKRMKAVARRVVEEKLEKAVLEEVRVWNAADQRRTDNALTLFHNAALLLEGEK